ncbi:MAG TPA: extracellular solute-binding protein [Acidimicrobiales bacterium]|nr:extracellular solute-binding protein [Acidimicrobiales bacterium]
MRTRLVPLLVPLAGMALVISACGSGAPTSGGTTPPSGAASAGTTGTAKGHGRVAVLYAGSLVNLMEHHVAPAFDQATGYTVEGFSGGSKSVAQEIKNKVRRGDVFLSASPAPDHLLMGRANGNWVSWYATFATSPLVIAYNPKSRFASQFKTKPWWQVVTEPGFKLGRTDPTLDPKGALIVKALDQAATSHHDPALAKLAQGSSGVFPEQDLVGRLQAGQLDAGFFYSVEAAAVRPHLPTVSISPIHLGATYTVTVLKGAPDPAGAVAFIKYLLGPADRTTLAAGGLHEHTPTVTGTTATVPAGLHGVLSLGS